MQFPATFRMITSHPQREREREKMTQREIDWMSNRERERE